MKNVLAGMKKDIAGLGRRNAIILGLIFGIPFVPLIVRFIWHAVPVMLGIIMDLVSDIANHPILVCAVIAIYTLHKIRKAIENLKAKQENQ